MSHILAHLTRCDARHLRRTPEGSYMASLTALQTHRAQGREGMSEMGEWCPRRRRCPKCFTFSMGDSAHKIHPLTHTERESYNQKMTLPALTHNFPTALSAASDICTSGSLLSGVFPITSAGKKQLFSPSLYPRHKQLGLCKPLSTASTVDVAL